MLTPELQLGHEINSCFLLRLGQQWRTVRPAGKTGGGRQPERGVSDRRASARSPMDGAKVASGSQIRPKSLLCPHVSLSAQQQGRAIFGERVPSGFVRVKLNSTKG